MTHAQTHIDTQFSNKATETEIEVEQVSTNEVVNGKTIIADKLIGELEIKDYPVLTRIKLSGHEIEKLTIINCPNLEKIGLTVNKLTKLDIDRVKTDADGNPVPTDKLKELFIGGNQDLEEISLKYCPKLEELCVPRNKKLDRILGLSKLSELRCISGNCLPRGLVNLIIEEKGLFPLPRKWENIATFYERQINTLREEKIVAENTIKEEREAHEDFMKVSEEWSKKQKQELLDEVKELKEEVEKLKEENRKLILRELTKEAEELKKQLEKANNQLAQIETPSKEKGIEGFFKFGSK